jgi:hypothetical protein
MSSKGGGSPFCCTMPTFFQSAAPPSTHSACENYQQALQYTHEADYASTQTKRSMNVSPRQQKSAVRNIYMIETTAHPSGCKTAQKGATKDRSQRCPLNAEHPQGMRALLMRVHAVPRLDYWQRYQSSACTCRAKHPPLTVHVCA